METEKINCHLINFSICLTDLNKTRLKKADNGKVYLNGIIRTRKEPSKFGDDLNMIYPKSKEEKELKAETLYIPGNARTVTFTDQSAPTMTEELPTKEDLDDLPY